MNDTRSAGATQDDVAKLLADIEALEFRARMLLIEHRDVVNSIRRATLKLDAVKEVPKV